MGAGFHYDQLVGFVHIPAVFHFDLIADGLSGFTAIHGIIRIHLHTVHGFNRQVQENETRHPGPASPLVLVVTGDHELVQTGFCLWEITWDIDTDGECTRGICWY